MVGRCWSGHPSSLTRVVVVVVVFTRCIRRGSGKTCLPPSCVLCRRFSHASPSRCLPEPPALDRSIHPEQLCQSRRDRTARVHLKQLFHSSGVLGPNQPTTRNPSSARPVLPKARLPTTCSSTVHLLSGLAHPLSVWRWLLLLQWRLGDGTTDRACAGGGTTLVSGVGHERQTSWKGVREQHPRCR